MAALATTKMSSKGQIVIPEGIPGVFKAGIKRSDSTAAIAKAGQHRSLF